MSNLTIEKMVEKAYETAKDRGWYDTPSPIPERLCLIHSEISEALEEYRRHTPLEEILHSPTGKPEGFLIELADVVIRIADLCGSLGLDLGAAIEEKMAYNLTREYRHGGKRC